MHSFDHQNGPNGNQLWCQIRQQVYFQVPDDIFTIISVINEDVNELVWINIKNCISGFLLEKPNYRKREWQHVH